MDFFGHQEQAKKNTRLLVGLFAMAVLCIITLLYLSVVWGMSFAEEGEPAGMWRPEILAVVAMGVLCLVAGGSYYKVSQLRAGGQAVAQMLGGRAVLGNTTDPLEQRLVHVVEEMAVASGTAVPGIYVLEGQSGINAFAAGWTPKDAAVAVTRGCLESLDRAQLQGVIAHEFSHIFHGDARTNVRLMGVLHGILCISVGGRILLELAARGGRAASNRNNKGALPAIALGAAMWLVGWIGVVFARLIKAGISRQREFLADASAVQYTRNPDGIAGALKAIGGGPNSRVRSSRAEEASHMFFASAFGSAASTGLSSSFATHPPLGERIRRIEGLPVPRGSTPKSSAAGASGAGPKATRGAAAGAMGFAASAQAHKDDPQGIEPEAAVAAVGEPNANHLQWSQHLLQEIPLALRAATREPYAARAVIHALLLHGDATIRTQQLQFLREHAEPEVAMQVRDLMKLTDAVPTMARLPLAELSIPALRQLSPRQYETFAANVKRVMESDRKLTVFGFALGKMLLRHLHHHFHPRQAMVRTGRHDAAVLLPAWNQLLSTLAHVGSRRDPESAWRAGVEILNTVATPDMLPRESCTLPRLDQALEELGRADAANKRRTLLAAARTAAADGRLLPDESDLIRAFADALDCPMPPLLAG